MAKAKEITNPSFDYSQISDEDAGKLRYFESELNSSRKRVVGEMIKHGEILHGAQQSLAAYGTGMFTDWFTAAGLSNGSVYNAIDAYKVFGDSPNLEKLEVSAIYALTKNEKAKKQALKLAEKGVKVTHSMAKRLIKSNNAPDPEAEDEEDSSGDDSGDIEEDPEEHDTETEPEEEEFPEDETLEEMCERETSEIESWARKIAGLAKDAQNALADVPTLDELNARTGWERKLNEALATLRSTKPKACPMCEGDGDKKCPCKGHGRVTRQQYNQMV